MRLKKAKVVRIKDWLQTAKEALLGCNQQSFPVTHKIPIIFLATPVDSVACEISFSTLRRLKL